MSDALTLPAETRERAGKGASRALRREGRIPAVIYGGKEEPITIHVEEKELVRQLMTGHFMNSLVMIEHGGDKVRTIPKDVSFHPVTDRPTHADFLRLSKGAKIEVAIPVVFINEDEVALRRWQRKGEEGLIYFFRVPPSHEEHMEMRFELDQLISFAQVDPRSTSHLPRGLALTGIGFDPLN